MNGSVILPMLVWSAVLRFARRACPMLARGMELTCHADDAQTFRGPCGADIAACRRLCPDINADREAVPCLWHDLDTDVTPRILRLNSACQRQGFHRWGGAVREGRSVRLVSLMFDDDAAVPLGNEPVLLMIL